MTVQLEQAESLYLRAIKIQRKASGGKHPDCAIMLNNLALLYGAMGKYVSAESLAADALESGMQLLEETSVVLSERQQLAMNQSLRLRLDNYLSLAIEEGETYRTKAAEYILTLKGATLVRQRGMRLAASEPAIKGKFEKLQKVVGRLATLSHTPIKFQTDDWNSKIGELTIAKEKLEAEISEESKPFRIAMTAVTPELIQESVPEGTVLIDYLQINFSAPTIRRRRTRYDSHLTGGGSQEK